MQIIKASARRRDGSPLLGVTELCAVFAQPRKETLLAAIEDIGARSFKYLYDFGDGWTHTVKIEKTFPATAGFDDPFLLEVVGRCPPEDVGGPWGYEEFREAIADTNHERHHELVEWCGDAH